MLAARGLVGGCPWVADITCSEVQILVSEAWPQCVGTVKLTCSKDGTADCICTECEGCPLHGIILGGPLLLNVIDRALDLPCWQCGFRGYWLDL